MGRPKLLADPRRVVIYMETAEYHTLEVMLTEYRKSHPEAYLPALLRKIIREATENYRRTHRRRAS